MKTKLQPYTTILQPAFIRLYAPLIVFLFVVALINLTTGIPLSHLTRDPISLGHLYPIEGIVSNIGVLLWGAAATICLFTTSILRRWGEEVNSRFLFFSGLLTLLLLVDDFFVLHEALRDYYGISEKITYGVYLFLIGLYLVIFRHIILNKNVLLFIFAFAFLGLSGGLDVIQKSIMDIIPGYFLLEDGVKLLGIASWAGYFACTAIDNLSLQFETK